jgi:hypothetical protein
MELWETPKLLVLCELVCLAQLWTSVAAACTAKFRHIPSAFAPDWGKSMTADDISDTLCRKMFYAVATKFGFPIPPQAHEEPPAFVGIAKEVCSRLRELRIRQIQEALKAIEAQQPRKPPVQATTPSTTTNTSTPAVSTVVPAAELTPQPPVKKLVVKKASGLPLPMPISIIPPSHPASQPQHNPNNFSS